MKKNLFLVFCSSLFLSCEPSQTKIERDGEPTINIVQGDDLEMNEAVEEANATLDEFKTALKSGNKDYSYFTLKTRFVTPDGNIEHIWVGNVTLKNNIYYGIVDNVPQSTNEVKFGDTIQIEYDNISDWMYLDNKKLRGGYTIRVLRDRMTPQKRRQFDLENEMIIY